MHLNGNGNGSRFSLQTEQQKEKRRKKRKRKARIVKPEKPLKGFVPLPRDILTELFMIEGMTTSRSLLLIAILCRLPKCYCNREWLMSRSGLSMNTFYKHISFLMRRGLICKQERPGNTTIYTAGMRLRQIIKRLSTETET